MTVTTPAPADGSAPERSDLVGFTVDGIELSVPKGTLVIRAAEQVGIAVPRFCDHPLLDPAAACRMCLVEIEGMPKPQPACAVTVTEGMVVRTQLTSPVADAAQHGVMEFLLINHPLDCPVCDKGGECPLQNQAMSNGRSETRFTGAKRTFPKPVNVSAQVLLDRERCISCARCTRFAEQIAGDHFIDLLERGAQQQVGIASGVPFDSYYSGNTIQICPVGALTSAMYRFRSRPFDLVSTPTACEHCASGCALRTDHRRGKVLRRMAANDPQVNEEWNCDKGRWAFQYVVADDRLTVPMVREDGELRQASWPEALAVTARGLAAAHGRAGVLAGGRLSVEDAYAYAKFARLALGTNHVDFRARPASAEEEQFLASTVAGRAVGPTYADLEAAPAVLLVALEPEEESPIVLLRLRKAAAKRGVPVFVVAPYATRGTAKMSATLLAAVPGGEPSVLDALAAATSADGAVTDAAQALRRPGAVVLVGERAAALPGTLSAVARLADATGARVGWVPRRAGERGAVEAGLLPSVLPGGRPVADAAARVDTAVAWGVEQLPTEPGLDAAAMLAAASAGGLGALVVAGVDPDDLADPAAAWAALEAVPFLVALDTRESGVTARADVVLPVATPAEKTGSFLDWEGRLRPFERVSRDTDLMSDGRVLTAVAAELGVRLGLGTEEAAYAELDELGAWSGERPAPPAVPAPPVPVPGDGEAVLATWRMLLDAGTLQAGDDYLAATARPPRVLLNETTAASLGAAAGDPVTVTGPGGSVTLPLALASLPDRVVFLPGNSAGSLPRDLGAGAGSVVRIQRGGAA